MYACVRCGEAENPREIITHHYAETYCTALSVTTEGGDAPLHPPVEYSTVSRSDKQGEPLRCYSKRVIIV